MTPLGALDALFLHLETPATPMHVGALHLLDFDGPPDALYAAIGDHLEVRLSASPVFTRRLRTLPLDFANPVWVDAAPDLAHHFQRRQLPPSGTRRQLAALVSQLHAQRLDRRRPLWQFVLIEGLDDGGCAFYTKVHHAAIDGAAGVALAQALLDDSPEPAARPRLKLAADSPPGAADLIAAALAQNSRAGIDLLRRLPSLAGDAVGRLRSAGGMAAALARHLSLAPPTVFNERIDGRRSIATAALPLAPLQQVAAAREVSINDVVLALVGGALRRYLAARDELPDKSLLAAMPVSFRARGDTQMNTQATMAQASLATDLADPLERLRAVHLTAATAKALSRELRPAVDLTLPSLGMPWLLSGAAAVYGGGLAERLPRLANVVVSNVPGPAQPLYLAGARLRSWWPLSIVEHGLGLNVTVLRYVDSLDFGIVAAKRLVHDAAPLAAALAESCDELVAAALPKPKRRRTSPPGRPKGESQSAQREGSPVSPPGRPKGESQSAQREVDPSSVKTAAAAPPQSRPRPRRKPRSAAAAAD